MGYEYTSLISHEKRRLRVTDLLLPIADRYVCCRSSRLVESRTELVDVSKIGGISSHTLRWLEEYSVIKPKRFIQDYWPKSDIYWDFFIAC